MAHKDLVDPPVLWEIKVPTVSRAIKGQMAIKV
jgi:hypothetical protein